MTEFCANVLKNPVVSIVEELRISACLLTFPTVTTVSLGGFGLLLVFFS